MRVDVRRLGPANLAPLRQRLVAVVTTLRMDINMGNTRDCQGAIEDLSESFKELENTDVPANYIVRLRQEQAGLRKSLLRVYQIQREEFLPSAFAMIVSLIVVILGVVMFTDFQGFAESLVTLGFLSFFILYLLRLLKVIDKPFKVGTERTDDDVSLFLLLEFVVRAQVGDEAVERPDGGGRARGGDDRARGRGRRGGRTGRRRRGGGCERGSRLVRLRGGAVARAARPKAKSGVRSPPSRCTRLLD